MQTKKRMTANAKAPGRYRAGKVIEEQQVSSDEESEEEIVSTKPAPKPKASSFPGRPKAGIILSRGDQQIQAVPRPARPREDDVDLEGFVTASESEDGGDDGESGSGSADEGEDSSEDEDSGSEDEAKPRMLAPKFISKAQRKAPSQPVKSAEEAAAEEEARRKDKADEVLRIQLEHDAAARAAGRKAWDDDDEAIADEVDDRDGADPEAERAAWKLRELKRIRRDREAIEEKEKEREEIERRRNMTAEEREAEDKVFIEAQKEEKDGRGKMGYMQKYFHKGAFFQEDGEQDEDVKAAMQRSFAGRQFVDDVGSKDILPEYMRIRDMTKLGKKGGTRYKDLKSEDTGRWGEIGSRRRDHDGLDNRFRPDDNRRGEERTGANSAPVGERRRRDDGGRGDREEKRPRRG